VLAAIAFILIVAAINARGIAESVKLNVVLTSIEVIGLAIIVVIGVAALGEGSGDFSRNFEFKEGESVFGAIVGGTALAFYAMIGFEDSINVVEETQQPSRSFSRALFAADRGRGNALSAAWPTRESSLACSRACSPSAARRSWRSYSRPSSPSY
jgi:amino acid transporter